MESSLYIDIGGTNIRAEIESGDKLVSDSLKSQDIDLIDFIEKYLKSYPNISHIAISFAGQINNGYIISSPNIEISHHNIKSYFEDRYNLKLYIDNDLNCAIRAEADYFNSQYISAIYVGTGLGSAIIDGGKIVKGISNQSFELGHIPYRETPFICGCGKSNCIELSASGLAIERWMRYRGISGEVNLENEEIDRLFKEALLRAVATLITLSNSEILVLGGGVIEKNPHIVDWIRDNIEREVMPSIFKDIKIVSSKLKNGAMEGSRFLGR